MKHLLIILISILLLSSPLFGDNHKGETLYLWETSSGIVWKGFGDKETNSVYQGDVENGKPNGLGIINFLDGRKYAGDWKDGKQNGLGTLTFGKGKWGDGNKYVGEWENGNLNGQGTFTWSDGRKYVGEWKDGNKNGEGTYTWGKGKWEGQKFVGIWKDGMDWNGTLYDKKGKIIGNIVNGVKNVPNTKKIKSGYGTETYSNGVKYEGEFKDGKREGQGIFTYPNGKKTEGKFKDGQLNGYGKSTFPDGKRFEGNYINGIANGHGKMTHANGTYFEGEWKKGKPWNVIIYFSNGDFLGKIVNGK